MTLTPIRLSLILAAFFASTLCVQAQDSIFDDRLEPFLDGVVRGQMDAHMIPGVAVAITEGDRTILLKGYGYADVEKKIPVDPKKHLFRVASISKPFAWTSLMQLAEAGKIDLEADVNDYLDFKIEDAYPGQPIRVRHLLTHTTGFEAVNIGSSSRTIEGRKSLGDALKALQPKRVAPPGVRTNYSNYGAALGGYIVERVSGMPYPDYLEKNIFAPLGMTRSTMRQPIEAPLRGDLVTGYTTADGAVTPGAYSFLNIYPDGALQTTAEDMARFAMANINPLEHGDVLSPEGFAAMHEVQFANIPQVSGMTFGFEQKIWNGVKAYGHGGDMEYFTARLLMFPEKKVSIFIALNTDDGGDTRDHIVGAIMDRYAPGPSHHYLFSDAPVKNASDDLATAYVPSRRNHTTIEKIFWPLLTGVSVSHRSEDILDVTLMGDTHPFTKVSAGVYVPTETTLGAVAGFGALVHTKDPQTGERKLYFSQNGSFLFEEPAPFERLKLHLALAAIAGFALLTGAALTVASLARRWRDADRLGASAAIAILAGAVLIFIFVPLIGAHLNEELVFGVPASVRALFWSPVLGLSALLLGALIAATRLVQQKTMPPLLIAGAMLSILAGLLLVWQLSVWNMLGLSGIPA